MTPAPWRIWTALWLVYILWGSTYLGIKYTVGSLPPLASAALRFAAAALLLAGWLAFRHGRRGFRATRRQLVNAAGIGLVLLTGANGTLVIAEHRGLPTGLAALIVAAVPLWVVLLRAGTGDRPAGRTLLGVAIGFVGVAVLLLPGTRPEGVALAPALMVLGSSLLWSLGSFGVGKLALPPDPLMGTVVQMLGGAAGLVVAAVVTREDPAFGDAELSSWLGLAYLVVFGSIVAFTAYSWLLQVAPVSQVATYAYVNPVVAVILGALFIGEQIGPATVVGGAITVLAVAVVVSEEGRRRRARGLEVPTDAPYTPEDRQGRVRSSRT